MNLRAVPGCIQKSLRSGRAKTNVFLICKSTAKDFELRANVRIKGDNNSGLQYLNRMFSCVHRGSNAWQTCHAQIFSSEIAASAEQSV